jgi:predicted O-methyltransferase YrrM
MSVYLLLEINRGAVESVSAALAAVPGFLGLEELPADGRRCFSARGTVRFDRVSAHERWVRAEKFQRGQRVRLKAYFDQPVLAAGVERPADYLAQYRAQHHGREVGRQFWVGPPWERPPRGRRPVIIEPGTAFGTGDHPSTQLCLTALERLRVRPRSAFDIGTGSGVLAIAIARLFPRCRLGVSDNDARCAGEVKRNFALNGLRAPRFAKTFRAGHFDLVVANLYSETLKAYLPLVAGRAPANAGRRVCVDRAGRHGGCVHGYSVEHGSSPAGHPAAITPVAGSPRRTAGHV